MSSLNDRRVVFVAAAFLAALVYGFVLFNFGPYAEIRERLPDTPFPEARFGYKSEALREFTNDLVIEQDGASQVFLSAYQGFQLFDTLNGALLALALATAIWALTLRMSRRAMVVWLISLPLLMFVFDLGENLVIYNVIGKWPAWYPGLGALAATFSMLKMIAAALAVTAILGLAAAIFISRFTKREPNG